MRKGIDIDALMADTWLTVTLLKQGATTPDGNVLYETCSKQVEQVRGALERAGYDEASIAHISYAQCALLDEVVMSRAPGEADAGHTAWRKAPLTVPFLWKNCYDRWRYRHREGRFLRHRNNRLKPG